MSPAGIVPRLRAAAHVFRLEYLTAASPGVSITFFLCARSLHDLTAPVVAWLVVVLCMTFAGLGINAIADRDVDRQYATFKTRIAGGIDVLGVRTAWVLIGGQIAIAAALTVWIAWQLRAWFVLPMLGLEALFGFGYSLPPFRFKLRGVVWHGIGIVAGTSLIPFVVSAYTYLGAIPVSMWLVIAGFSVVQYGWEFANQAVDYLEDRSAGWRTPAVRLGVVRSMQASLIVPLAGMALQFSGLYILIIERARLSSTSLGVPAIWLLTIAPMLAGYIIPIRSVLKMLAVCRTGSPEVSVPKMAAYCNYARWQASSVTGVAVGAGVFYAFCR